METKHTPGPWTFGSYCESDGSGYMFVCTNTHKFGDEETEICRLQLDTNEGANARLIAAAPELLAALKDTFDALLREKIAYNQRIGADYETAHKHALLSSDFAAARAAISKATS